MAELQIAFFDFPTDYFQRLLFGTGGVGAGQGRDKIQKCLGDGGLSHLHVAVVPGMLQGQDKVDPHILPDGDHHILGQAQPLGLGDAHDSLTLGAVLIQALQHSFSDVWRSGDL